MLRREGNVKGDFNLKPRQKPMEMQLNIADVNRQWGVRREHPAIQRVMGSLARTMIDFFQEQSRPNN